jgi:formylglycine-generating enzyme required for sulfatase activity
MRRSGSYRVSRGSCWDGGPRYARVAYRHGDVDPAARRRGLIVRLVEEVDDPPSAAGPRRRRGGCWYYCDDLARVAVRGSNSPGENYDNLGVRLVEEVEEDLTPASGSIRVYRGGGWFYGPQFARGAFRGIIAPGYRYRRLGVRLVEVTDA